MLFFCAYFCRSFSHQNSIFTHSSKYSVLMTKEHLKAQSAYHQYHKEAVYHGLFQFFLPSFPASQPESLIHCTVLQSYYCYPRVSFNTQSFHYAKNWKGDLTLKILTTFWLSVVNKIQVIFCFCPCNWGRNWSKAWRRLSWSAFCLLPFGVRQQAFFRCKIMSCQDVYLYCKSFKFQLYK